MESRKFSLDEKNGRAGTRDGTVKRNSRVQTLRRERGQRKLFFPCQDDQVQEDWQPYPVDVQSIESDDHTHTHTVLHHALARSLRKSKVQSDIEDTWPFQQRDTGQQVAHNP